MPRQDKEKEMENIIGRLEHLCRNIETTDQNDIVYIVKDIIKELKAGAALRTTNARAEILQALSRGYCSVKNDHKILDVDLIEAMADELAKLSPVA
jgi:hypothetical protein